MFAKVDPKQSIQLLDELTLRGFDNSLYAQIHHFRLRDRNDTITAHLKYCETVDQFAPRSKNALVQYRIRFIHDQIESRYPAGEIIGKQVFQRLVDKAVQLYPFDLG